MTDGTKSTHQVRGTLKLVEIKKTQSGEKQYAHMHLINVTEAEENQGAEIHLNWWTTTPAKALREKLENDGPFKVKGTYERNETPDKVFRNVGNLEQDNEAPQEEPVKNSDPVVETKSLNEPFFGMISNQTMQYINRAALKIDDANFETIWNMVYDKLWKLNVAKKDQLRGAK